MLKKSLCLGLAASVNLQISFASDVLEEVIVTAQKREQSLQDVPVSVLTLNSAKLDAHGIGDMTSLSAYVPNLTIGEGVVHTNIFMRGVGSGNNQAFEQSVGMYIDSVYMGRGRQYRAPLFDIERVEVLRGPQGTLFGKNTIAGAVNIITASADYGEEFNGKLSLSYEDPKGYSGDLILSGAISDDLSMRLAARVRQNDGFIENKFLNRDEPETEETYIRWTTNWRLSEALEAQLKYSYADFSRVGAKGYIYEYLSPEDLPVKFPNSNGFALTAYGVVNVFFPELASFAEEEFTAYRDSGLGKDKSGLSLGNNPDGSENNIHNTQLKFSFDGEQHQLVSISAFSAYDYLDGMDADWLPFTFINRDEDQDFRQLSQEFRLLSKSGGPFNYLVGAYFEKQKMEYQRHIGVDFTLGGFYQPLTGSPNRSLMTDITGGAYSPDITARNTDYRLDTQAWAFFTQLSWQLAEQWLLNIGLRYTNEDKDVRAITFLNDSIDGLNTPSSNPVGAAIQGAFFDGWARNFNESRSTDKWLPSVQLQWQVSDQDMLYLSASEGFKSGGFSASDNGKPADAGADNCVSVCTVPNDDFEFDDEEVLAFEFGGKHELMNGRLRANWALFRSQYENQQVSVFKGLSFAVSNAAESTIQGLELDLAWQINPAWRMDLSMALLDAQYDSFVDAPCTALQIDRVGAACGLNGENDQSGQTTNYAPDQSASLSLNYQNQLSAEWELFWTANINYSAEYSLDGDNDPVDIQDSYSKVNSRVSLKGLSNGWELSLYGHNLTDEEVAMFKFDVPILGGTHGHTPEPGRTIGLQGAYHF